jgi:hypothetical protein
MDFNILVFFTFILLHLPLFYCGCCRLISCVLHSLFFYTFFIIILHLDYPRSISSAVFYSCMSFIFYIYYSPALTSVPLSILQIAVTDFRQQGATQEEQESQAVGMRQSKRVADSSYNITSTTDRMAAALQRTGRNYQAVTESPAPRPSASSAAAAAAAAAFHVAPPFILRSPAALGVVGASSTSVVAPPTALVEAAGASARGGMVQVLCPPN